MNVSTAQAWEPCIPLQERETFLQLIKVIDRSVIARLEAYPPDLPYQPGIMAGHAGAILYLFHSAIFQDNQERYDQALTFLDRLLNDIHIQQQHSLCNGTAGSLWLLLYLQREQMIEMDMEGEGISEELVQFLCEWSLQQLHTGAYDYMHQGLGTATALLCSSAYAKQYQKYLEEVVKALAATATKENEERIFWKYTFSEDGAHQVSLGMSHGLPGIIAVLSKISQLHIQKELCHELIRKTCNFLLHHRNPEGILSLYPSLYGLNPDPSGGESRLGWCYGDMGIAASFIHAGRATGNAVYFQEAHRIIDHLMQRPENETPIHHDGSVCHGDWGIAHIYQRLYHYRRHPALYSLAAQWFQYALKVTRVQDEQIFVLNAEEYGANWTGQADVLNGIAGTGLVILSGIAPIRPAWDEILFLDIQ